uniref:TIGR04013 family B12-binding domain/radical SAM domain-containing protein n=1 Tax=Candidatus Caldatribacterium californiense TaxID=1454726 RepID=A0A7V3YMJ6_9BACT
MIKKTLLFLYSPKNRLSMNALLGALYASSLWERTRVVLCTTEEEVLTSFAHQSGVSLLVLSSMTPEKERRQRLLQDSLCHPDVFTCCGGPHATALPQDFAPWSTFLVQGEGEVTFLTIVQAFLEGTLPSSPQTIKGERAHLDRFPSFPYHLGFLGPIEISRGCPFGCAFCQTPAIFGRTMRHRSLESILEHVRGMMHHRERVDLRFVTPNAFAYGSSDGRRPNIEALENLLGGLRKLLGRKGRIFFGSFPSEVRPEFVSEEILHLVRQYADNRSIVIGAQSGSQRLLSLMGRGHTPEDVLSACETSIRLGFQVYVDFIFGCPEETEEDLRTTAGFIEKLVRLGAIVHAHTFLPLPGTPWGERTGTPIPRWMRQFLGKLAREGKLRGQWQTQERMAREFRLSEER